jgi:hypothetical protein
MFRYFGFHLADEREIQSRDGQRYMGDSLCRYALGRVDRFGNVYRYLAKRQRGYSDGRVMPDYFIFVQNSSFLVVIPANPEASSGQEPVSSSRNLHENWMAGY